MRGMESIPGVRPLGVSRLLRESHPCSFPCGTNADLQIWAEWSVEPFPIRGQLSTLLPVANSTVWLHMTSSATVETYFDFTDCVKWGTNFLRSCFAFRANLILRRNCKILASKDLLHVWSILQPVSFLSVTQPPSLDFAGTFLVSAFLHIEQLYWGGPFRSQLAHLFSECTSHTFLRCSNPWGRRMPFRVRKHYHCSLGIL